MSATSAPVKLQSIYEYVFDHAVTHSPVTVGNIAQQFTLSNGDARRAVERLGAASLIEVDMDADTDHALVTCPDADSINRKQAMERYAQIARDYNAQQDASAAPSTPRVTTPRVAAAAAAAAPVLLTSSKLDKGHVSVTFTTTPYVWETPAVVEHRNERTNGTCVVCSRGKLHTVSLPICSPCYNSARKGAQDVMGDRAVVRAMRSATPAQLEEFVSRTRVYRKVDVQVMSAKAAAKLLQAALETNAS